MQVTIELPDHVASLLSGDSGDVSHAVLEAVLITAVRDAAISQAQARRVLGVSRYEMDGILKRHGVGFELTIDTLDRDTAAARAAMTE
jgi:hypothetical protein